MAAKAFKKTATHDAILEELYGVADDELVPGPLPVVAVEVGPADGAHVLGDGVHDADVDVDHGDEGRAVLELLQLVHEGAVAAAQDQDLLALKANSGQ